MKRDMSQAILFERNTDGMVATLTIHQPLRRNAITSAMWESVIEHLNAVSKDCSIRVLVVRGSGDTAFSAGADIHEFTALLADPAMLKKNNRAVQEAQVLLEELERPTIAMIKGACFGGGCGLAMACDFRISDPTATFAITPAKLGLMYSVRDTKRLLNIVGASLAKELLYTGRKVPATEALQVGLVTKLVAQDELEKDTQSLASQLASASQYSLRGTKKVIAYLQQNGASTEADLEKLFDEAFAAEDGREGASAFLEKRAPKFN